MKRALLVLLLASGCATLSGLRAGPAWEGWGALADGDSDEARTAFDQALAADPADPIAAFGRASVAFERGETAAALDGYLRVLEQAPRSPMAHRLAPAAAARLETLMDEALDRRPIEARVLALPRSGLPWAAQVELAEVAGEIARRRADPALLVSEAARAGCLTEVTLAGILGRLPHLDLEAPPGALRPDERRLAASGCRLMLPSVEGHPGVRLLRAPVELPAGAHHLVLAFTGPALMRVDGGPWHRHGSLAVHGPRRSALRVTLAPGKHQLEVRVGTFGGTADLMLLALPATADPTPAADDDPLHELAAVLAADAAGDGDRALEAVERVVARKRFAVGLAAAARVVLRDPTRPANIDRDGARLLHRKAAAVDERLARVWRDLAMLELLEERPREAGEAAERAVKAAPGFFRGQMALMESLRGRGLERDADRALGNALAAVGDRPAGGAGCAVLDVALRRAQDRRRPAEEERLAGLLERCDPHAEALVDRLRQRGELEAVERSLRRRLPTSSDPGWLRGELAQVLLARGQAADAAGVFEALVKSAPRDPQLRIRLADTLVAAGDRKRARVVLAEALRLYPTRLEVRAAARALEIPLPLDAFRLDGAAVIRDFKSGGRRYDAPAVVVLDRSVGRVFADGAQMVLTHNIVRVQTKDGIERWGEIAVPEGAEVLTLRTHKPDGSVREPEEIFGKATISAPDLAPGDFVEWETLEAREPVDAFAPGFLGERFYFQSTEAPLDRSEYLLVTPAGLPLQTDGRAGAPAGVASGGPEGTRVTRFIAHHVPQLFPERSSVGPIEWIPSVRVSSGVSTERWVRFVADQLVGVDRSSPALRKVARELGAGDKERLAERLVKWVNEHIEPESDLAEPATYSLARRRGNRAAVLLALGRALGLQVDLAFGRSLATAPAEAPVVPQELDDFGDVVVRIGTPAGPRYLDPRLRRAPFGYLPPTLAGAPLLLLGERAAPLERARSTTADARNVSLNARLGAEGDASATVVEELTGWAALEWVEMVDRAGNDQGKLRQDFEQRSLSQNFPGAVLTDLAVELRGEGAQGARVTYRFTHPELASRDAGVLKIAPTFFRTQPGRRYATEPSRRTTLLLGADVPCDLEARLELPAGAKVIDAGDSGAIATAGGAIRFAEQREVRGGTVIVRRQSRLPLSRVAPADYATTATQLRRVDPLEQEEIRFKLK